MDKKIITIKQLQKVQTQSLNNNLNFLINKKICLKKFSQKDNWIIEPIKKPFTKVLNKTCPKKFFLDSFTKGLFNKKPNLDKKAINFKIPYIKIKTQVPKGKFLGNKKFFKNYFSQANHWVIKQIQTLVILDLFSEYFTGVWLTKIYGSIFNKKKTLDKKIITIKQLQKVQTQSLNNNLNFLINKKICLKKFSQKDNWIIEPIKKPFTKVLIKTCPKKFFLDSFTKGLFNKKPNLDKKAINFKISYIKIKTQVPKGKFLVNKNFFVNNFFQKNNWIIGPIKKPFTKVLNKTCPKKFFLDSFTKGLFNKKPNLDKKAINFKIPYIKIKTQVPKGKFLVNKNFFVNNFFQKNNWIIGPIKKPFTKVLNKTCPKKFFLDSFTKGLFNKKPNLDKKVINFKISYIKTQSSVTKENFLNNKKFFKNYFSQTNNWFIGQTQTSVDVGLIKEHLKEVYLDKNYGFFFNQKKNLNKKVFTFKKFQGLKPQNLSKGKFLVNKNFFVNNFFQKNNWIIGPIKKPFTKVLNKTCPKKFFLDSFTKGLFNKKPNLDKKAINFKIPYIKIKTQVPKGKFLVNKNFFVNNFFQKNNWIIGPIKKPFTKVLNKTCPKKFFLDSFTKGLFNKKPNLDKKVINFKISYIKTQSSVTKENFLNNKKFFKNYFSQTNNWFIGQTQTSV